MLCSDNLGHQLSHNHQLKSKLNLICNDGDDFDGGGGGASSGDKGGDDKDGGDKDGDDKDGGDITDKDASENSGLEED